MLLNSLQAQMAKNVRYVQPVAPEAADGLTAQVYDQLREDFMIGPVLTLHSPQPAILAGVWSILRESLMAGRAERTSKEAVAATVSKINECPFCIDAHTTLLHASAEHAAAEAIQRGDFDAIADPVLRAHAQWAVANRTRPAEGPVRQPFTRAEAPEFLGTALAFHYINRMANVFLGDSFLPVPAPLKDVTRRLAGSLVSKPYVRRLPPGRSLKLIPRADLPEDFAWAAPNEAVAQAYAGFIHVVESAGRAALPARVRDLVERCVADWQGEPLGISPRWVDGLLEDLPADERPAARLALLTALASYQVDAKVIADFKAQCPEDAQLVAAAAWASLTAARRINQWMRL